MLDFENVKTLIGWNPPAHPFHQLYFPRESVLTYDHE